MILGKFLPPHAGHQHLVQFGLNFAKRLHLLVCTLDREPIPGELRRDWMSELFPQAQLHHITADLPQEPSEHPQFWDIWRETVQAAVGEPIDYVFASEDYGRRLADELGAQFIPVDVARSGVPISGTAIREAPLRHWEHLPTCVRPYYAKRVCVFGPESTGKSTLARDLAAHFHTVHVPEFARGLLDPKQGECDYDDIAVIARGQAAAEDSLARRANRVLLCDTDLWLTTIWSDVLFGKCPTWIAAEAARRKYDLYLLLDVDVPWVDDAQRYLPHKRQEFFNRCHELLKRHRLPYQIIRGDWQQRFESARDAVSRLLQESRCVSEG